MLEPCDAKVSRTVPRGLDDRKVVRLLGRNAKEIICRKRFGVLALFAFSGMNKPDFAPNATSESHGSRVGGFTTASPVCWVVQRVRKTASPPTRRSKGLSCVQGNLHAQFLEGWAPAMGPGYSIRKSGTETVRQRCIC